jgi:hypothetical protein
LEMDLLCIDLDPQGLHHITTTCHDHEPLEDVINMANFWFVDVGNEVELIEL